MKYEKHFLKLENTLKKKKKTILLLRQVSRIALTRAEKRTQCVKTRNHETTTGATVWTQNHRW